MFNCFEEYFCHTCWKNLFRISNIYVKSCIHVCITSCMLYLYNIHIYHCMCGHQVSSIPHVISVHELVTSFSSDLSLQACFLEDNRVRGYSEGECEYSVSVNLSFTALETKLKRHQEVFNMFLFFLKRMLQSRDCFH